MPKKPFHSERSADKKSFGNKEGVSSKRPAGKDGDKPAKKSYGKKDDHPFKKFEKGNNKSSYRKTYGAAEDKPRKAYEDRENKSRKSHDEREGRPRKSYGDRENNFRKSRDEREGRPRKASGDRENDFRKSRNEREDGPRKFYEARGAKDARESSPAARSKFGGKQERPDRTDKRATPFGKKPFDKSEPGEKKPNRYAHAFGRMDDEELAAHKKKVAEKLEEKEGTEEVTFEKELKKWEDKPIERKFGKSDIKFKGQRSTEDNKGEGSISGRHRHDASSRFKQQFDDENPHEKAYSAGPGKKEGHLQRSDELDGQAMPLNKYIAHCDVCSRRDAVVLIKEGKVTVNGAQVLEPGLKVTMEDEVQLNGQKLVIQKNLVYILMNKPKGFITTTDDPKGRRTVMDMLENHIEERVFPIGRLDRNTTGLLLLTNDGALTQKLSHPKYEIKKVYKVTLDKNLSKIDFEKILGGLELEDGRIEVDQLEYLENKNEIGLEIHSGKNRIVRRIFAALGYEVEKLDRVVYAGLTKKHVLRGKWRFLTKQEVINLKHLK